ncbi:MAG: AbrB/MazE/SpoVT family DNA-binding domain-containing protein [Lautropia sp.]|nr:AbrB/MazE/SpoVT family DNA-binding domain-containing protein [Lautropia sp.]
MLTSKGQVTIPKHIRDALGLVPGSQLDFVLNERGDVVRRRRRPPPWTSLLSNLTSTSGCCQKWGDYRG